MCVGYSPLPRSSNTPLQDLSSRHYSTRIHPMILPVTWKINLNWMIPNLYMGNGCLTKHPFKFGCLEFQVLLLCQNHRENAGTQAHHDSHSPEKHRVTGTRYESIIPVTLWWTLPLFCRRGTIGCPGWYLGSMDWHFTPIEVGWIRPINRWVLNQLTKYCSY